MNRALHRFAALTTGCTFLLLMAGALVTGNDAADSVPDWPLAYHRLIPPLIGGIRFEYAHRVTAGIVSVLTLVLAIWIAATDKRRWLRRVGWTALALVFAQALLGAMRVLEGHPALTATAHATLAQIFFIAVVSLTVFLGPWWNSDWPAYPEQSGFPTRTAALWTTIIIVIQTILGAGFRHGAFGILPHLIGAAAVTAAVIITGRMVRERFRDVKPLREAVIWLHATFGAQILLGILAYWAVDAQGKVPQPVPMLVAITVAHVLGGALLLAASVLLTLRCYRLTPAHRPAAESSRTAGAAV
jgi:heme A synthase